MASKSKSPDAGKPKQAAKTEASVPAPSESKGPVRVSKREREKALKAEVAEALKEKAARSGTSSRKPAGAARKSPAKPRRSAAESQGAEKTVAPADKPVPAAKPKTTRRKPRSAQTARAKRAPGPVPSPKMTASENAEAPPEKQPLPGIGHNSEKPGDPQRSAVPGLSEWSQWAETLTAMQKSVVESMPSMIPSFAGIAGDQGSPSAGAMEWIRQLPRPSLDEQQRFTNDALALINGFWDQLGGTGDKDAGHQEAHVPILRKDRRFSGPEWQNDPIAALTHQFYLLFGEHLKELAGGADSIAGQRKPQLEFAVSSLVDALSPANFPLTNPKVLQRAMETKGESIVKGLTHAIKDAARGQISQVDSDAFTLGENIATTPGKVIYQTPLFQLIHYAPVTDSVDSTPLLIFPPWINRFYILDLTPAKSFVRWCVEQGLSVFIVSWKSADESIADTTMDDYSGAMIEAMDVVREQLDVPSVHTIGYCVAGTVLAATLAALAGRQENDRVASATFFTAQVDFEKAGDLLNFVDNDNLAVLDRVYSKGVLDGRYIATAFNMLRGNDLIWNYVVNNYLLGDDYKAFDLLYWNSDYTNLPAGWHKAYLADLYRDNKLVKPGAVTLHETPVDLGKIVTPLFIQAGKDDHIAPLESVWRITEHVSAPVEFCLAGSGHIAGVVNPPSANKYQYWTSSEPLTTLNAFLDSAVEKPGSWWPHWRQWLLGINDSQIAVAGARVPGNGKHMPIEDAPGTYVQTK